jgi:hypothetical protein
MSEDQAQLDLAAIGGGEGRNPPAAQVAAAAQAEQRDRKVRREKLSTTFSPDCRDTLAS